MTEEVSQFTLEGDEMDVERRECEMYPICSKPAEFEVETLVYDGTAQVFEELGACQSCAREVTEPEEPEDSDKARELRRTEVLIDE